MNEEITVMWSITSRCNFRCRHCCVQAGMMGMDAPEWLYNRVIAELTENNIRNVVLTGGECFFHSRFGYLIRELTRRNIVVRGVLTNASLITSEILEDILTNNPKVWFQVSFDGIGYHDIMRGVNGAEELTLNGIKKLIDYGIRIQVATSICTDNFSLMPQTLMTMDKLHVNRILFSRVLRKGFWVNSSEDENVPLAKFYDFGQTLLSDYFTKCKNIELLYGIGYRASFRKQSIMFPYFKPVIAGKQETCSVCSSIYISTDGDVMPCSSFDGIWEVRPELNIMNNKLTQILETDPLRWVRCYNANDIHRVNESCLDCSHKSKCNGGCRALSYAMNNVLCGIGEETCYLHKSLFKDKVGSFIEALNLKVKSHNQQWEL